MTVDTEVRPLPVEVTNDWRPLVKDRKASKTTFKTYVLNAASTRPDERSVQICDYEPTRLRLVVQVIDVAVAITTESPVSSPDAASGSANTCQGRFLPPAVSGAAYTITGEYVFYGPDAFWINTLSGVTTGRVTVTKEYE